MPGVEVAASLFPSVANDRTRQLPLSTTVNKSIRFTRAGADVVAPLVFRSAKGKRLSKARTALKQARLCTLESIVTFSSSGCQRARLCVVLWVRFELEDLGGFWFYWEFVAFQTIGC